MNNFEEALADLQAGRMIILVDDEKRENEGDLIIAAEKITPEAINFMTKVGRGLICFPLTDSDLERLQIPMMIAQNRSAHNTPFTLSIGAAQGMTTGISAFDRAHTIQVAMDPKSTANDIVSPGHIFPLRAHPAGVFGRPGHTEGSIDLMRAAGLRPAAVLCEILKEDGSMARLPELLEIAKQYDLKLISIRELIAWRVQHECLASEVTEAQLPIHTHGNFTIKMFENIAGHPAVVLLKESFDITKPVLTRIHSECFTGDILGSIRCDCGWQLETALKDIAAEGGVLIYLRQEGRGIGLVNKIKAYQLQDQGLDTVEANHQLGFDADHRDYSIAAEVLHTLGIKQIRLLTNNPAKIEAMKHFGISVSREAIEMPANEANRVYLSTKRDKLGHFLCE